MRTKLVLALALLAFSVTVSAQEGETWNTQTPVHNVTLIKIHPNMEEVYLNNLRKTWVTGMNEAKKEGFITEYSIYQSLTDASGSYNLILVTTSPNMASFDITDETRAKAEAMEARIEKIISEDDANEISRQVYPGIRDIMSSTLVREIKFTE